MRDLLGVPPTPAAIPLVAVKCYGLTPRRQILRPHSLPFSFPNLARSCWNTAVSRRSHALISMPQETTTLGAPLGSPPCAHLGESQLEPLGAPPCTPAPSRGFYFAAFWRAGRRNAPRKMSLPPAQWRATAPTRHARPAITARTFHRRPAPSRCAGNRSCPWGGQIYARYGYHRRNLNFMHCVRCDPPGRDTVRPVRRRIHLPRWNLPRIDNLLHVLRLCAAPHADGTVTAWGHSDYGGIAPALTGVCNIFSTTKSFAALQADRAVMAWGHSNLAASPPP